jgi:hypothetical protein
MTRARGGFSEKSGENAFRGQGADRIVVVAEAAAKPNGKMRAQAVK